MVTQNASTNYFTKFSTGFPTSGSAMCAPEEAPGGLHQFRRDARSAAGRLRPPCSGPVSRPEQFLAGQKVYTHGDDVRFCAVMTIKRK